MKLKKICVIGLGYIGLPTAAILANHGYKVSGIDIDEQIVQKINQGSIHIAEPDLAAAVNSAVNSGRLKAFTTPQLSDIYIICVPTPLHEKTKIPQPNLKYVFDAALSLKFLVQEGNFVILESTSPVGTTLKIKDLLHHSGVNVDKIHIAYCPERVLPGKIMKELIKNDRVVGGLNLESTKEVAAFYQSFARGKILETDAKTAEMCKLTENSFRDVNIAFANQLSLICDKQNINVWNLIKLANRHPRVNILEPGIGVGGHCIAVDPWFVVFQDKKNSRLIQTAREVNNYKTDWVIEKIKQTLNNVHNQIKKKPKIAFFGLTFKPDVDDLRGSPAVKVVQSLIKDNYDIVVVEPNVKKYNSIPLVNIKDACEFADIIVVLVKHREFVKLNEQKKFLSRTVLDFCGAFTDTNIL